MPWPKWSHLHLKKFNLWWIPISLPTLLQLLPPLLSYLKFHLYSSPSSHYSILIPKIKWSIIWKQYLYFVLGFIFNFNFHETGIIHLKPRKLLLSSHHIMKWSRCYKNIKWKKLYISFIIQCTYCIPSLKVIPILRGTRCQHLFYYVHVPFPYKPNINNTHPFVNRLNVNYKNPHWGYLQTNWEFDHLPLEKEYSTKYAFCNNLQVFEQHLVGAWLQIHKGCISSCHIYAREPRSRSGCGRPRVGVGGLWILSSYNKNSKIQVHIHFATQ